MSQTSRTPRNSVLVHWMAALRPVLTGAALAFGLFASVALADIDSPKLLSFSIAPQSVNTTSGPIALSITIAAKDGSSGFGVSPDRCSITFTHESGTSVFGRQSLPMTGGTTTNPVFQFLLNVPEFSPPGTYRIGLVLVDNASNTATVTGMDFQRLGLSSTITVTQSGLGSVALSPSRTTLTSSGGSGSLSVIASSAGFSWFATASDSWLRITSNASQVGNGTFNYFADTNGSSVQRRGMITVAGQVFMIVQEPASNSLTMTTVSQFRYDVGGMVPLPQRVTIYDQGVPLTFTSTASSTNNWVLLDRASGVTSTTMNVFVNPIGLVPGTYTGRITVKTAGLSTSSESQPVTLVVGTAPTVVVTPSDVSFFYQHGGMSPTPQILSIAAPAPVGFTVSLSSPMNWLSVELLPVPLQPPGTTPVRLLVSVLPSGLGPGLYSGNIKI